jgi:hypothetical protein
VSQEILGVVADIYIPLIILLIALELIFEERSLAVIKKSLKFRLLLLISMLSIAFGSMAIDNMLKIWPKMGLDYSTHSAVALVLIMFLYLLKLKFCIYYVASLLLYFWLMVELQYHTLLDIFSTMVLILPLNLGIIIFAKKLSIK